MYFFFFFFFFGGGGGGGVILYALVKSNCSLRCLCLLTCHLFEQGDSCWKPKEERRIKKEAKAEAKEEVAISILQFDC